MQIVSLGGSLHELSKPISWKKKEHYSKMSSAVNVSQHAKS